MASNLIFDGDSSKYQTGDPLLKLSQEKRAYVEEVAYYAQQEYSRRVASGEDWVLPEVAVSQAILETGWGQHRGANDFGIKAWSGSNRSKTTLATKEQNADGSYYGINSAFEQTSSIEDSVALYYDFITSNSRYSKALNLTDPYQSIREIKAAGYATSLSYADNLISIVKNYNLSRYSSTSPTSFEYSVNGYNAGIEAYEESLKIITNLEEILASSESKIKMTCSAKPQIDYESIIQLKKANEIVLTLKDLLFKIKGIADREKYIAEQYNIDSSSLNTFKAATLSIGTMNYSFNNNEEFIQMVNAYKANGSSEQVFSTWFQSYVSNKGIASSIIDMKQYKENIKSTYAETSDNYIISKASEVLQAKETMQTIENTSSNINQMSTHPRTSGTEFATTKIPSSTSNTINTNHLNSSSPNKQNVSDIIQSFKKEQLATNQSQETTSPIIDEHLTTNILTNKNNYNKDAEYHSPQILPSQQNSLLQPGYISDKKDLSTKIKDITTLITPGTTSSETITESEIPTESTITEIIPGTNKVNKNENITTPQKKGNNFPSELAIGLGVAASAVGIGAGTYYASKKRKEQQNDSAYVDNDEYQDDYYEDDQQLFEKSDDEYE